MRIVLFCENKYAISILTPIQDAALKTEIRIYSGMYTLKHTGISTEKRSKMDKFHTGDIRLFTGSYFRSR